MEKEIFKSFMFYLPKGAIVLDAVCGNGYFGYLMRNFRKDIRLIGIDLKLKEDSQYYKYYDIVIECDLLKLNELVDTKIDGIFCNHVLEHIPKEKHKYLVKVFYNKLNKGGYILVEIPHIFTKYIPKNNIVFSFWNDPTHRDTYGVKQCRKIFEDIGFKTIISKSYIPSFYELKKEKSNFLINWFYKLKLIKSVVIYFGEK